MKLKNYLFTLAGACLAGSLSAQAYFTPTQFFPTGVNNDGVVVGHKDQATICKLWYPETGKMEEIPNSVSSGPGAGGVARFSGDGKTLCATLITDDVALPTEFTKTEMFAYPDITFGEMVVLNVGNSDVAYMVGTNADGTKGVVLRSSNGGHVWRELKSEIEGDIEKKGFIGGFTTMAALNYTNFMVAGHNAAIYLTRSDGRGWEKYPIDLIGNTKEVDTYWALDFIPEENSGIANKGVVGLEFKDQSYAVYYTTDQADTYHLATGVAGRPTRITHFVDAYFMGTLNGHAQKSTDFGATWTDMFVTEGNAPVNSIEFLDENVGMAATQRAIYVTTDGGSNWSKATLPAGTDNVTWNDLVWNIEGTDKVAIVIGSGNSVYETRDNGATWTRLEVTNGRADANLCTIDGNSKNLSIGGAAGTSYWKSKVPTVAATTAAIYNMETQSWTQMANLGLVSDGSVSSPWDISDSGDWLVGNVTKYAMYNEYSVVNSYGTIWDKEGNMTVLPNKFADRNRPTRAAACSSDGSVVTGWQDIWGPWYACVWRRNPDGTYTQKLMLKDPNVKEEDLDYAEFGDHQDMIKNCLGMSRAVSSDGKWIAGRGEGIQTAVDSPWIWSEESGLILLDEENKMGGGTPVYVNNEGTLAVGHGPTGLGTWIWRKGKPLLSLEEYAAEVGMNLKGYYLAGVYDVSQNERYVTGWCMKGDAKAGYRLDLMNPAHVESVAAAQCRASIYPNPVSDELHVDLPYGDVKTNVRLLTLQGMAVKQMSVLSTSNTMYLNDVPEGLYLLDVEAEGMHKTFKVEVVH